MTKNDVKVGETYRMNHTSGLIQVRILSEKSVTHRGHYGGETRRGTHWVGLNLKTGHRIEIKSAAKLQPTIQS